MSPLQLAQPGVLVTLLALLAAPAVAQTTTSPDAPPSRRANVWDGRKHPPSADAQNDAENADGATTPTQQRQESDEVEQLRRQVLRDAQPGNSPGAAPDSAQPIR